MFDIDYQRGTSRRELQVYFS